MSEIFGLWMKSLERIIKVSKRLQVGEIFTVGFLLQLDFGQLYKSINERELCNFAGITVMPSSRGKVRFFAIFKRIKQQQCKLTMCKRDDAVKFRSDASLRGGGGKGKSV